MNKPHKVDRNGLWLLSEESSLDMRRCLPGLSAGLAAMCAVIANRFGVEVIQTSSASGRAENSYLAIKEKKEFFK